MKKGFSKLKKTDRIYKGISFTVKPLSYNINGINNSINSLEKLVIKTNILYFFKLDIFTSFFYNLKSIIITS